MQSACATLHCHVACLALPYVFTLSHKRYDFPGKKKLLDIKCVLIFYTYLGWKISHYKKNSAKYCHKCTKVFTYSSGYSYRISIKLPFYGKTFEKYSNIKFHDNPSSGSRFVPCGRKQDRHGAANSLFYRNFVNVPRNKLWTCLKAYFPAAKFHFLAVKTYYFSANSAYLYFKLMYINSNIRTVPMLVTVDLQQFTISHMGLLGPA